MRRRSTLVLSAVVGAGVLLLAGCAVTRIGTAVQLAKASEPLQVRLPAPAKRLLVVGDSTAVGTGASSPAHSVAGLVAARHPDWSVENRATDGAKLDDVAEQLRRGGRYDIVLVMAGANDVIRFTGRDTMQRHLRAVLECARERAPEVVLMPAGNVGNAPFFWPPWSWWMSARARMLHGVVRETAAAAGATYVGLYQDRDSDPFALQPQRYHAADGLHPSDAGYALWGRSLLERAGW
jgi:lysophospholipase L1-like esterase